MNGNQRKSIMFSGVGNPFYGRKHTEETLAKMRGRRFTKQHKLNLSKALVGRVISPETRRKIGIASRGKVVSVESRKKISSSLLGHAVPDDMRQKISLSLAGRRLTKEQRIQRSEAAFRGEKHHNWKGGITPVNEKIRHSQEYVFWRIAVFERDNYTCVLCSAHGVYLHADHIKRFADYPELRFDVNNGRTLCVPCHRMTPTYGSKKQTKVTLGIDTE